MPFIELIFVFQDIENVDDDELVAGAPQYTDDDVIATSSENDVTANVSSSSGQDVGRHSPMADDDRPCEPFDQSLESCPPVASLTPADADLQTLVTRLTQENEELKRQVVCKICMDPVYTKPLVTNQERFFGKTPKGGLCETRWDETQKLKSLD